MDRHNILTKLEGDGMTNGDTSTITVLVTGFAPFQGSEHMNPSSMIASLLPSTLSKNPAYRSNIRIICYPYPIRVAYDDVRSLVPRLFQAYQGEVDLVLHIGVAPERSYFSIERQAHRDGYDQKGDVEGKTLDKDDGATYWPDCPPTLQTSLEFDDVYTRWRRNMLNTPEVSPELGDDEVRTSDDPGRYLCDFLYYSMLAEYKKHPRLDKPGMDPVDEMPVIFLHVPAGITDVKIRKGKLVTIALIRALAESWAYQKEGSTV